MYRIFYLLVVLSFFNLKPYEGEVRSLFNVIASKNYHLLSNGKESPILDINGIEDFVENILNNKKPVVCFLYSSSSERSLPQKNFFEKGCNGSETLNQIDIAFIDVSHKSNEELVKKLMDIFVQCALQVNMVTHNSANASEEIKMRISNMLKNLIQVKENPKGFEPFLIFFKGSNLLIPRKAIYLNKEEFIQDFKDQLLNEIVVENENSKTFSNKSVSFWNKTKNFFKKIVNK